MVIHLREPNTAICIQKAIKTIVGVMNGGRWVKKAPVHPNWNLKIQSYEAVYCQENDENLKRFVYIGFIVCWSCL